MQYNRYHALNISTLLYRLVTQVGATKHCSGIRYIFAAPVNTTAPESLTMQSLSLLYAGRTLINREFASELF